MTGRTHRKGAGLAIAVAALIAGIVAVAIAHSFDYDRGHHIPADEVRATEAARDRLLAQGA